VQLHAARTEERAEGDNQVPDCFKPVRYNLIDRTIDYGLLKYCQEHHITVIVHSPFATNLPSIQAKDPGKALDKLAQSHSRTVAQNAFD
jgi:diketogulonate reductase-like aldo/keto reductase